MTIKYNLFDSVRLKEVVSLTDGGMATVYPQQLELVQPARETVSVRAHLLSLLDELSEEKLALVRDFAEFLQQKQKSA